MYELAILKQLGERIGYSLNIEEIIEIITGSLRQFMDYSAVSYMLLEPEKIIFRLHLEKSVTRQFIKEVKERMLKSLSTLLDKNLERMPVEEVLSGAILIEEVESPVGSFFNIPLVIGEKVVGVLTVSNTKTGLYKNEEMTILYKIIGQASQAVTRLQEVVKTEQRKLNSMVESLSDGVIMTDKDLRILVANPAAKEAVGLEKKEDLTIFDFIDQLNGKFDIKGRLEESIKHRHAKPLDPVEVFLGEKFFQVFVLPVQSLTGPNPEEILGGVVIFHDITKEKELEKLRRDFTSMVVHELRSPLDGIKKISFAMTKWDQEKTLRQAVKYAQMIFTSSSNILETVSDLLDAAKIEAGKFELKKTAVDLREIIRDRLSFFGASAEHAKIELSSVFGSRLPGKIEADAFRIVQVLNNLISSAIKFTLEGGTVSIKAFYHQAGKSIKQEAEEQGVVWGIEEQSMDSVKNEDEVVVAVADSGVGISQENQELLFSKFKQLNLSPLVSEKRGSGLGLVIVKGIVESHGGTVRVVSDEGQGSTFYFTLPMA